MPPSPLPRQAIKNKQIIKVIRKKEMSSVTALNVENNEKYAGTSAWKPPMVPILDGNSDHAAHA